jgi:catechol 2,3-dioxygenase-like lactoylglutathione lyase family enzyme
MQITHTHHMALVTAGFARLRAFYEDVLGCNVLGAFPGRNIVFLDMAGTTIELVERTGTQTVQAASGWNHLALEVPDVDAA